MKKLTLIFIIFILFFQTFSCAYAAKKKKETPTKYKIEFTSKDKFLLVGDLYLAKTPSNKPLIVLLHSFGVSAKEWKALAEDLRLNNYNVLAMDLRGHGRSVYTEDLKLKSRYKFTTKDWQKLPNDIVQSINYVKANYASINCNDTIFVGADIGGSAGILAGLMLNKQPEKFIWISPMLNFKGLYIPVKVANYTTTRFMLLLAKTDKVLFNFYTKNNPIVKTYPQGGPGNRLLSVNPESINDIVNFILN